MNTKDKNDTERVVDQIVIAEDSPTQAEQLRYLLEKHEFEVIVAKNGKEALNLVAKHTPVLVISDIVMPEMNGYELCKELKSYESTMDIPVILLTSLTSSEDVLEGISCGADNFITKPYREDYLIAHVEQIIANRKFLNSERVRVGVEIIFGGKRRFITATQQQMLSLLISTYEAAVRRNDELIKTQDELKTLNEHLEEIVKERTTELLEEIVIRKKAEERIRAQNEKLNKTNTELILAKDRAEESDRLKSAFLANMSHEIRTPMNSIMGFASLLPEEDSIDLMANYAKIIVRSSEHLVHIIDDIVLYSRLQTKLLSYLPASFNVHNLLADVKQSFSLPDFQKEIKLNVETDNELPVWINSDYEKLRQVFANLISNAFKYTCSGSITIGFIQKDSELEFFVRDTGLGIPENEREKVFERFYRGNNVNKGVIGGTGLGLSIVKELVILMNGKIWVESEENEGSTFIFTVPYISKTNE